VSTRQRADCSRCKGTGREKKCEHGKSRAHWTPAPGQKEPMMCNGPMSCGKCGGSGKGRDEKRRG
jgi:hypothetical protein